MKQWYKSESSIILVTIIILPFGSIYLFGFPEYIGRIIAVFCFYGISAFGTLWFSLNPKADIMKNARLSQPGYETAKKYVSPLLRTICFILFIVLINMSAPFFKDIYGLISGTSPLQKIEGKVGQVSSGPYGMFFFQQYIHFEGEFMGDSYKLFYSLSKIREKKNYEFFVLKRSRFIVQVNKK